MRRHRRNGETGSFLEAYVIRQPDRPFLRHGRVFRSRAERPAALGHVEPHPLADLAARHTGPELVDDPRPVLVRNDAGIRDRPAPPAAAALGVRRIDGADHDLDPHFARPRLRGRHVAECQHVTRRARPLVPAGFHVSPPEPNGKSLTDRGSIRTHAPTLDGLLPRPRDSPRCPIRKTSHTVRQGPPPGGLPRSVMPTTLPRTARSVAAQGVMRRLMHAGAYLLAAVLGLSVGPTLFILSDRATALRWANAILDFVGR